jgi:predicted permease
VVLVSLGIFLTRRIPLRSVLRPALIITALRLAVAPALFYAAAALTGETAAFRTAVLEAAMPLAITPFALSSMYPLDRNVIVTAIFLTTLLSVVTIPLWILLLQG